MAGAKPITKPKVPMYLPRSCGSKTSKIVVIINGIIIPDPIACTILAHNKTVKFGLNPAMIVPIKNIKIAVKKTCLVEKRCIIIADNGTTMPFVNKKAVVSHCTCV